MLPEPESFPAVLDTVHRFADQALAGVADRPVAHPPAPVAASPLPVAGVGFDEALATFARRWEPGFSGSAGPRYLGFVTGGATPAALAGDWLTSTFDQNAVASDSSAVDLERETVGWLAELFGLGVEHTGTFVTGATMSNFVGLALGRQWLGEQRGISVAHAGVQALGPVRVLSGTPHSTVYKALSMLGIGRDHVHHVPVQQDREAVDLVHLRRALEALNGTPAIVVANAGTVNTVDFDDLRAIAALRDEFPFWLHVDAAFGGFAALSPAHAHLVDGMAEADSVCVDLHKWLNVPYDAAVQFTRHQSLQLPIFQNVGPYLPTPTAGDLFHLTPESSRRLRALPAWFTLTAYGAEGHRAIVENNIANAHHLAARLTTTPGHTLLSPVSLNVVCFTPPGDVAATARAITASGEAFVTPTVLRGVPALRAAFSNWRTTEADVDRVYEAIVAAGKSVE
ncbi:pyridoxal phosphate-dependent decarboxylase family protein [Umezawaea sp. NPDC059074]|uniref:pyridoxal phosphate-dependent decarboxylase family protein n=1 Tax=Umezawaea sp. NPDC059074 TaxID=3346716 RepID=UPI0036BB663F